MRCVVLRKAYWVRQPSRARFPDDEQLPPAAIRVTTAKLLIEQGRPRLAVDVVHTLLLEDDR